MASSFRKFEPWARSILRVVAGFTFCAHGVQKIFGWLGGMGGHGAKVPLHSLAGLAGGIETVGGILIVFGLFTPFVAFILSGEMAFAYFRVHAPHGFFPIRNGGELAVLYCFIFLYFAAAGAGPLSADAVFRHKS
jgi:putative oxidoreductase